MKDRIVYRKGANGPPYTLLPVEIIMLIWQGMVCSD